MEVDNLERIRKAHLAKMQQKISMVTAVRNDNEDVESPSETPSDDDDDDWLEE